MRVIVLMFFLIATSFAAQISPQQLELLKQSGYKIPIQNDREKIKRKKQVVENDIEFDEQDEILKMEKDIRYDKAYNKKYSRKYDKLKSEDDDEEIDELKDEELKRFASNFFQNSNKIDPYSIPVPSNYKLARGDIISIDIYGAEDKSFTLTIDRKGSVVIPQVGELKLLGLGFDEAKEYIIKNVKDAYPSSNSILVNIDEFTAIQVTISGLVKAPGLYNLSSFSTIKDALIASGGITNSGSYRNIILKRAGKVIKNYDLYKLVKYGDDSLDSLLQTGDIIYVKSVRKELKVSGSVVVPSIFELKQGESFKTLLSFASGLKANANKKAITLKRYINNKGIKVYTLSLGELYRLTPKNGDELFFPSISEQSANYVTLKGNVTNPREVEIPKDKRLSSLFKKLFKDFGRNGIFKKNTNYSYAKVENTDISKVFNLKNLLDGKEELYLKKGDFIIIYELGEFKDKPFIYVNGDVVKNTPKQKYEFYEGLRARDLFSIVVFNNEINKSNENNKNDKNNSERYNERYNERTIFYDEKELEKQKIKENPLKKSEDEEILNVDKSKIQIKRVKNNRYLSYTIDLNIKPNFLIKPYDVITFFSISQVSSPNVASIRGEVFIPKTYNIGDYTTINELVKLAGGFTKRAAKTRFELVRYKVIGDERVREVKTLDLKEELNNKMRVYPDDEITIRGISNWYEKLYVDIKGEVRYPGKYAIKKGEKLSSLIKRAGGFTNEAFVEGAVFTREQVKKLQISRLKDTMARLRKKSLYLSATPTEAGESQKDKIQMVSAIEELEKKVEETQPIGRVAINLYHDMERFKSSVYDISLENEDSVYIPTINDTVSVVGEVLNQNTFVYNPKYSIKDYINRAGGETEIADGSMIYVVKANGDAIRYKKSYFFSDNVEVFKGDTIVVPFRFDTVSDIKYAKDISSIVYQLAVTAASLKTLGAI